MDELEKLFEGAKSSGEVKGVLNRLGLLSETALKNTILPEELESAKICVRGIYMAMTEFPEAKGSINTVRGFTNTDIKGALGTYRGALYGNIIGFNSEKFKTGADIERLYAEGVKNQYYPQGTDARSVLVHEIGHALIQHIRTLDAGRKGIYFSEEGKESFDFCDHIFYNVCELSDTTSVDEITKMLSEYAVKNHEDFVCEALSEALVSAAPRATSLKVYKAIKEKLNHK